MITYNVLQGGYHDVYDSTVSLPDGFELITGGDSDVGHMLHKGHSHYLGCTAKDYYKAHRDEFNAIQFSVFDFGPLVFISIQDIKFRDEYPYLITAEEFNNKWQFSNYRVARFSENRRLLNMFQIKFIESEFNVHGLEVTTRDYADIGSLKSLKIVENTSISRLLVDYNKSTTVVSNNDICLSYWNKLISDVLTPFGGNINHIDINFQAAYEVMPKTPNDFNDLLEYMAKNAEEYQKADIKSLKLMNFDEMIVNN